MENKFCCFLNMSFPFYLFDGCEGPYIVTSVIPTSDESIKGIAFTQILRLRSG